MKFYEFLMFWARNSRLKILEFLSKNSRIPKPCVIPRLDPRISALGNSKIP